MSSIAVQAEQRYTLNGVTRNAPVEWLDTKIEANYTNDDIQPQLSIEEFKFVAEAREDVRNWIGQGLNGGVGIFEGMPFELRLYNNTPQQESFKGFIDFTNEYKELPESGIVSAKVMKDKGLDNFFEQLEGTTFGFLASQNAVTLADYIEVDYVVEKKFNFFEIVLSSIVLYLMIKELAESIERTADSIALVSALLATSALPLPAGSIAYSIASAIIQITYTAVLLLAIINLAKTLFETLVPPKRKHKAIMLRRALERACQYFGYNLVAPIAELDNVAYLPSNPNLDQKTTLGFINILEGTPVGIPNTLDFGYNCAEMFQLAKRVFYAKMAIVGNTVHLRAENDPYWTQQSTWQLPSILIEQIEYNTDEMKSTRLITFDTDLNDEWTIDNFNGTAYEIRTSPITTLRQEAVLLKGLDEVQLPVCLGTRKDNLNAIENLLKAVAQFIDNITGIFGGGTSFANGISSKLGVLKQSSNWHSLPKLLYVTGSKLPVNHRNLWNAQVLYDKYHKEKSFVLDNYRAQKIVYRDVKIPFGFRDFQQLTVNPYFLFKGKQAKITKFVWTVAQDTATISFWVREPYTKNLKETYIRPL